MTGDGGELRVVLLAGQRQGIANPLAERFGTSHKCLIPLAGEPLIAHVLQTLAAHERVNSLVVSVEREAFGIIYDIMSGLPGHRSARLVESQGNIADSVLAALADWDGPAVITTADHALLCAESIDAAADALESADAVVAMARRDAVLGAHPDAQRRFYEFRDDAYSNCNLYGLSGPRARAAAEIFRGGGQFAKSAMRIVRAFGLVNLLLLRFRLVSLAEGLERISHRMKLRVVPVILTDGTQAIDVDNDRTYAIVDELIARRATPACVIRLDEMHSQCQAAVHRVA